MRRGKREKQEKIEIEYEESSGNVFKDLGLPNPEERLAKARLASMIYDVLEEILFSFSRGGWNVEK